MKQTEPIEAIELTLAAYKQALRNIGGQLNKLAKAFGTVNFRDKEPDNDKPQV